MEDAPEIGTQLVTAVTTTFTENLPAVVGLIALFMGVRIVIGMVRKNAKP